MPSYRVCASITAMVAGCGAVDSGAGAGHDLTMSETSSSTITTGYACSDDAKIVAESSYYRAFNLADQGVTSPFDVTKISVAIASAKSGDTVAKLQKASVILYSYTGAVGDQTIDLTSTAQLDSVDFNIADTASPVTLDVPFIGHVPDGVEAIVAELHIPDGAAANNSLFIGLTQTGSETEPGYERAPSCGHPSPVTHAAAGFPNEFILITVTGHTS